MFIAERILTDQPKQAHRIRRHLLGVASSVVVWLLMFALFAQGHMEGRGLAIAGVSMLLLFVAFYAAFRTGLNLKASDPSLTTSQIFSSNIVTLVAMYYTSSAARDVLTLAFVMSFFFGVFRFKVEQFVKLATMTTAGYVVLIAALLEFRPATIDLQLEIMRCGVAAVVLFWFSMIGGYVSRLRKRLADNQLELEQTLGAMKAQLDTDELTNSPNRRYLTHMLRREQARNRRSGADFCVCIADIDHFKSINDDFGHNTGDEVLRAIAATALRTLRVTDYFGRYGGDELMWVLTDATIDRARFRAEQLRDEIASLRPAAAHPGLRVTLSIGVAQYRSGEDVEHTVKRADLALYKAKERGRNQVAVADEPPRSRAGRLESIA